MGGTIQQFTRAEFICPGGVSFVSCGVQSLGQFIREERDRLNISLRELARRIKVSAPFLTDIELGRRFPSDDTLKDLATTFGRSLEDMKQYDPRATISELKRIMDENPGVQFAFRKAVNQVRDGSLTAEELAKKLGGES